MTCRTLLFALCVTVVIGCGSRGSLADDQPVSNSKLPASEAKTPERERDKPEGQIHRTVYFARNATARSLLYLLEKHFGGQAGIKFLAEPNSNMLSIRANSDTALEEVLNLLARIDRPLRQIALQVLVIEFNVPTSNVAAASAVKPPVDTNELTGSAEEVLAKLRIWLTQGHLASVQKYQLNAVENSETHLTLGEIKALPSAVITNATSGFASPVLTMRNFGTVIQATPTVTPAGEIELFLSISDNQLLPPELGTELAKGENGPIMSRATKMKQLRTSLTIADGKSSVASGWQIADNSSHAPSVVVVSARILALDKIPAVVAVEPNRAAAPVNPAEPPALTTAKPEGNPASPRDTSAPLEPIARSPRGPTTLFVAVTVDEAFVTRMKLPDEMKSQIMAIQREMRRAQRNVTTFEERRKIASEFEEKAVNLLNEEQKAIWAEYKPVKPTERGESSKGTTSDATTPVRTPQSEQPPSETKPNINPQSALPTGRPTRTRSYFSSTSLFSLLRDDQFRNRLKLTDEQQQMITQLRMDFLTALQNTATRDERLVFAKEVEQKAVNVLNDEQQSTLNERIAELGNQKPIATEEPITSQTASPESRGSVATISPPEELPKAIYVPVHDKVLIGQLQLTDEQQELFGQLGTEIREALRSQSGATREETERQVKQLLGKAYRQLDVAQKGLWTQREADKELEYTKSMANKTPVTSHGRTRRRSDQLTTPEERLDDVNLQLEKRPNSVLYLQRRASILVEMQRWNEAITDLQNAVKARPNSFAASAHLATILAYQRDEAGFRECTRRMLQQLPPQRDTLALGEIADACLLAPEWLDDPDHVKELFEQSVEAPRRLAGIEFGLPITFEAQRQLNRSRLDLLCDQPLLAIKGLESLLNQLDEADRSSRNLAVQTRLYLAMAMKAIGDDAKAEAVTKQAQDALASASVGMENLATHVLLKQVQLRLSGSTSEAPIQN